MNYIELLTQEEKVNLCGIMGGRDFKELFKHNEREFQKIRKGFRAKSLTEELALSIAIANVDKPFIASWVNARVQIWLDEIQENITKLEGEGSAHDIALATTMLDFFFSHDVDLYLKLAGITMDEVSRTELRTTMERIESDRAKEEKDADRVKALEEEKQRLLGQIEDCHQSASLLKTEYEQRIQEIEQDKKDLESSLAAAQEKISELQTSLTVAKSDESSHLSQYDDTDISSLPPVGSEETISLCNVISDYSGQKWLIRFADLSHNGHYHMFHRNEELPPYFSNRDKIFYKDGPSTDGFYGIWSWSAIPNEKDPSKDYIISKYNVNLDAIEIATIPEASSLEELIHLLKDGFVYQPHSRRIMFSLYASKGQYMGILCSIKELNVTNGKVSFAEDCIEVPVYEFNSDNILRLENGLSFYRNAFAGLPNKLYQLKSPLDIVKNNEGRKVLLFSDSRQRAAKLARDMSDASDISAARQLFAIAIKTMEEQTVEQPMNSLYDFFCLAAGQHHVQMFHSDERIKFAEDCTSALNNYSRCVKRGREYTPRFTIANAPVQMQEYLLRLFAGGYNTLYDSATSWIEPTDQALFDAVDALDENHIKVTEKEFIDVFNAWMLSICDMLLPWGIPSATRFD